MSLKDWPSPTFSSVQEVERWAKFIARTRDEDITQANNYTNIFIRGRLVGKVPSGSADVAATDKLGDINFTDDYMYVLIDNSGTAEWRRVALGSW